jgi:hypothetical protein
MIPKNFTIYGLEKEKPEFVQPVSILGKKHYLTSKS